MAKNGENKDAHLGCFVLIEKQIVMNCETMDLFLMLWPDISRMSRITSDVINGTDFTTVAHIASLFSVAYLMHPLGGWVLLNFTRGRVTRRTYC